MDTLKFKETENQVWELLNHYPETRSNDYKLYYLYCMTYGDAPQTLSFADAMNQHYELGLPSWETVTRCRRKIQEYFPYLKPETSRVHRQKRKKEFVNYARN